jgi:4-hydroxybenzoate polyprenyltransferase/phosphoserine phosphatase
MIMANPVPTRPLPSGLDDAADLDPLEGLARRHRPLVLDLDGTVVRGNLLVETALAFLRQHPLRAFMLVVWLLRGRAALKQQLALATEIDTAALPLNEELLSYAAGEKARGRDVYVATAADRLIAEKVAARLPFVTGVISSDGRTNLKGPAKAAVLAERFPGGFDYAGDARADLAVWRIARRAIVVEASPPLAAAAGKVTRVAAVLPRASRFRALLRSLRPHQWAKNALVFVPIILSGRIGDTAALSATFLAFLALGCVASATYVVNDILDLADDRRHWSKRERPLASGRLPLLTGALAVPVGLVAGFGFAALAGAGVVAITAVYLASTLAYSLKLKRVPILDGFTLASLFTLRIGAGILASAAPPSPWLLVFSMFLFASLSFAKRHTEVARVIERGGTEIRGRGYKAVDLPLILSVGIATGMCAVLILVLYIIDDAFRQSFYGNTLWLWGFPAVLFLFICRIWLMCQRGQMNDDPVVFAVTDRPSLALGAALMVCFVFAWVGVVGL